MSGFNFKINIKERVWIFPVLSILTIIIGKLCVTKCSYLGGNILGMDLNTFGILFYSLLFAAVLLHKKLYPGEWVMKLIAATVCAGIGAEIIFIKFQVQNNVYCAKCLIAGFFLLLMFFVVVRRLNVLIAVLLVLVGVLFTSMTFKGYIIPSYGNAYYSVPHPVFGNEKSEMEIVVFSDYYCPHCRDADPKIDALLRKLKNKAKILFVDVPMHPESPEYAELFLYSWFSTGNNLEEALRVRELLFKASLTKTPKGAVLELMKAQKIPFIEDKARARKVFMSFYDPRMKNDKIRSTPQVVITKGTERGAYIGGPDIVKALEKAAEN